MAVNNRSDRLLRLLLSLHEAPHSGEAWSTTLSGLSRLVRCDQVAMVEREGALVADAIAFGAGSDERFNEEYRTRYARMDPFATDEVQARLVRRRRSMRLDELVPREQLEASAFYNDYWRRHNLHDGLAAAVTVTGRRYANFCALHASGRSLSDEDKSLFDLFVSHARAALRQRHATSMRDAALRGLLDSTDCLADAVFVVDGVGALVQSNAAADELLARGDVVRLRGGELRLGRSNGHDPLADLMAELVAPRPRGEQPDPIRCLAVRESGNGNGDGNGNGNGHGKAKAKAKANGNGAASAEGGAEELLVTAVRMAQQPVRGAPAAILFLRRGAASRPVYRAAHLRDLFGLTPAESRIANALLAGERVEDMAARLGVRADTVRGHVKRMLSKTGTRRQSDLVCRLASAAPSLRAFATEG